MAVLLTPEEVVAAWDAAVASLARNQPEGLFQTAAATKVVKDYLYPTVPPKHFENVAPPEVIQALGIVVEAGGQDELLGWLKDTMRKQFGVLEKDVAARWEPISDPEKTIEFIAWWYTVFRQWYRPLEILTSGDASAFELFQSHFQFLLLESIPNWFPRSLHALFTYHLIDHPVLSTPHPSFPSPPISPASQLHSLGLLTYFRPLLFSLVYDLVDQRITETCKGEWTEEGKLDETLGWLKDEVGGWLVDLFMSVGGSEGSREKAVEIVRPAMGRFEYHVYKQLGLARTDELFDIIVDFPDSMPALNDLKICLSRTELRPSVISKLRTLNARRLLHPGADTKDIIAQYISMIKALRVLDPPGVLLSRVAEPVRHYLRGREDTIRCVVSSLVEPGHALGDELAAADPSASPSASTHRPKSVPNQIEVGDFLDPDWTPDPVDAPPDYRSSVRRDVVDSLVSIYETRDGFVKELQALLAQRLLAIKDFDASNEIENVEILKRRFGEAPLQPCDVMLKDVADSKRADTMFREQAAGNPLRVLILSRMYWPNVPPASFKLPTQLAQLHTGFERVFTSQKADKRLRWVPQLGTVDIEIKLEDRIVSVEASMLQASVATLFSNQDTWTVDRLAEELALEADLASVRNALYFWANQGLLKEVEVGTWRALERQEAGSAAARHVIEESPTPSDNVQTAQIQKMRVFWAFIQGMLTNLGTLPLDRIHTSLSMLAPGFKGTTREELRVFLEAMQRERLVEPVGAAEWRLAK